MKEYNYTLQVSRLNELIIRVERWLKEKGILKKSTIKEQILKLLEELKEFSQAIDNRNKSKATEELDMLVVIISIACLLNGKKDSINFIKESLREVIKKIEKIK